MNLGNLNTVFYSGKKHYMDVNVILTFEAEDVYGDTQEVFDLKIPVSKSESDAVAFTHRKLFKRIVKKCILLNRHPEDLIKISIAANWRLFETVSGQESLPRLGHSCKWYFGEGRSDLDLWEKRLIREHRFGTDWDMSWISNINTRPVTNNLQEINN